MPTLSATDRYDLHIQAENNFLVAIHPALIYRRRAVRDRLQVIQTNYTGAQRDTNEYRVIIGPG